MNKTNENLAIEAGKPIMIEADSRQEATTKIAELRQRGEAGGLTHEGGFIQYERTAEGIDKFSAVVKFNAKK